MNCHHRSWARWRSVLQRVISFWINAKFTHRYLCSALLVYPAITTSSPPAAQGSVSIHQTTIPACLSVSHSHQHGSQFTVRNLTQIFAFGQQSQLVVFFSQTKDMLNSEGMHYQRAQFAVFMKGISPNLMGPRVSFVVLESRHVM